MYNQKYNYQKLSRVEKDGVRRYKMDGTEHSPVPSVTTILSALADKTHLNEWRNRVGHKEADRISRTSAGLGTQVHLNLENHILEEERPLGNNLIHQMARGLADIVIDKGLSKVDEYWGVEVPLYCPELYAGTTDCVGIWKGKEAIIDFKTTRRPKKQEWIIDYFHQGCAYATAHNEVYGTNIRTVVIMMIAWDEGHEGEYQEFVIDGEEFDRYQVEWLMKVQEYYAKFE